MISLMLMLSGCSDDKDGGFQETYTTTSVLPQVIATNLNFPWGIDFINESDPDATGNGSALGQGNLLVANRGTVGEWANTVTHVNPHTGHVETFSHAGLTDQNGLPAVNAPHDAVADGPFVWIANDSGGLGTVAFTDANPSVAPNGPTGQKGEPVAGPAGSGVFNMDDFGFMVTSVTPEDQSVGVFHHTTIAVEFSAPVDPNTIRSDTFEVQVDYSPLSPDPPDPVGSYQFSDDYRRVEFIYIEDLKEATRYKIVLDDDILSVDGVALDGDLNSPGPDAFTSTFTVGTGNPRVIWIKPENGEAFVPTGSVIQIGFSEPVLASSVSSSAFVIRDSENDKISGDIFVDDSLTTATFVPQESLANNMTYFVEVNYRVRDLSGQPLDQIPGGLPDAFTSSFSTGAGSSNPPQVSSSTIENDVLTVVFTSDINPESRTGSYLSVVDSNEQSIPGTITWPADSQLIFTATNGFYDGYFTVCVEDSLTDYQGLRLDGDGDGIPGGRYCASIASGGDRLYVSSSFPEDGDQNVGVNSMIFLNFSKAVNPVSITDNSVFIAPVSAPQNHVPAVITVNPGNISVTINVNSALQDYVFYTMTVTTDVTDLAGNSLDQLPGLPLDSFVITFQTGGEDNEPPCVFETTPTDGDTNIPVGTAVSVKFTEAIVPSSITDTSFYLMGPAGRVNGNFQFNDGNATVRFQPIAELTADEDYTLTLTTAITDGSGNGFDGDCDGSSGPDYTITFTTGTGGIVINEVVVDPQQDWNDSEGGDGSEFNDVPGTGAITTSDEWIELFNASGQTVNLNNWSLEMIDSTAETHIIGGGSGVEVVYPPSATLTNFPPGAYLVIGNPTGSNNMDCYFVLRDVSGTIVDDLEIGDDPEGDGDGDGAPEAGEDGNADSIGNEAVARVPNGVDTDLDQADCSKQTASIGVGNGGKRGFGTRSGYWGTGVGLVGMSGIVAAGEAPDEPDYMSRLIFASHTRHGIIYGIDLDDGPYFVFGGCDAPMGVEYIPSNDDPKPGRGYLFITDPENGNLARIRVTPSGPVGSPYTQSVVDNTGVNHVVYMTYPLMNNPVDVAYSSQHDRVYIACRGNGLILEITRDGDLTEIFDTGFGADALGGVEVGDLGQGDVVFVTNTGGERVGTGDGNRGSIAFFNPHP